MGWTRASRKKANSAYKPGSGDDDLLFRKNADPAALPRDVERRPEPPPFAISTEPPAPARRWWPWLLAAAGVMVVGGIVVWQLRTAGQPGG
jgi:hypothetical protein